MTITYCHNVEDDALILLTSQYSLPFDLFENQPQRPHHALPLRFLFLEDLDTSNKEVSST